MEEEEKPQNRLETVEEKQPAKPGQFVPGDPRINRGGRPKGIARVIREMTGEDGEKLLRLAWKIARGKLTVTRYTERGEPYEAEPNFKERMQAIEFLADRGHGKPAQTIELANREGEAFEVKAEVTANVEPGAIEALVTLATRMGLEADTGTTAAMGEALPPETDEVHSPQATPDAAILPLKK